MAVSVTGTALAQSDANTADSSGCGVGTILFEGQQGPAPQVVAITTNGTFGNQTFGITFGTLGCNTDGVVPPPAAVEMISISSLDALSVQVAQGEGETL